MIIKILPLVVVDKPEQNCFRNDGRTQVMNAETCVRGKIASEVRGPAVFTWIMDFRQSSFTSGPQSSHSFNKELCSMAKFYFLSPN